MDIFHDPRSGRYCMRIGAVFLGALLGCMVSMGSALSELFEGKGDVEGAICRKLAMDYANDSSSLTVQAIAELQICLAQTLKKTASPPALPLSRNFDMQPSRSSTSMGNTMLPTPPTPPTPPKSLKIP